MNVIDILQERGFIENKTHEDASQETAQKIRRYKDRIEELISLVDSKDGKPGGQFYRIVAIGKQSERMINLFGAYENAPETVRKEYDFGDMNIDDVVGRMERFVVDEYRNGGVTAQAKDRLDKIIDAMQKASNKS